MEKLLEYMYEVLTKDEINKIDSLGFFTAPASTNKHCAFKGGLAKHTYNVVTTMLEINEKLNIGLTRESVILAGVLHDIDKCFSYTPNILKSGEKSTAKPYTFDPILTLPHGVGSLYVVNNIIKKEISLEVATAIIYHMGCFQDNGFESGINYMLKETNTVLLVWLLQTADQFATWILEYEFKGGE